jgi:hypothetical protein
MTRMSPVLVRRHRDNVTGDDAVQAPGAERDHASTTEQAAARRSFLDREHHELDRPRQIEVVIDGLVLAAAPRCRRWRTGIGGDAQPRAIRGDVARGRRPRGHLHVRKPDAMLAPILATAAGDQASPRVAVVLDPDQRQGLGDDMDVHGQRDGGFDRAVQRPELPGIVAGLPDDLGKEVRRPAPRRSPRSSPSRGHHGFAGACVDRAHERIVARRSDGGR